MSGATSAATKAVANMDLFDAEAEEDAQLAAAKRQAIVDGMQQRRQDVLDERERQAETRVDHSQLRRDIVEKAEREEAAIRADLDRAADMAADPAKVTDELDRITGQMQVMDRYLTENADALPNYEVRRLQQKSNGLRDRFREVQDALQPKKKFGFKGKKKKAAVVLDKAPATSTTASATAAPRVETGFVLKDKHGQHDLVISAADVLDQDVSLSHLTDCHVRILGCPSTLHLTHLTDCRVDCRPVSTSAYLDVCTGCDFSLACQQLRAHRTEDARFYLHVTSRAIIEDCRDVHFAPYDLAYDEDFDKAGLSRHVNNWDKVDDFNWLAVDRPSPNWHVLPVEKRRKESTEAAK